MDKSKLKIGDVVYFRPVRDFGLSLSGKRGQIEVIGHYNNENMVYVKWEDGRTSWVTDINLCILTPEEWNAKQVIDA
jgi:hypothetical protein